MAEATVDVKRPEVRRTMEDLLRIWDSIRVACSYSGDDVIQKVYQQLEPIDKEVNPKEGDVAEVKGPHRPPQSSQK